MTFSAKDVPEDLSKTRLVKCYSNCEHLKCYCVGLVTCKGHCRQGCLSQQLSQTEAISTLPEIFVKCKKQVKPLR